MRLLFPCFIFLFSVGSGAARQLAVINSYLLTVVASSPPNLSDDFCFTKSRISSTILRRGFRSNDENSVEKKTQIISSFSLHKSEQECSTPHRCFASIIFVCRVRSQLYTIYKLNQICGLHFHGDDDFLSCSSVRSPYQTIRSCRRRCLQRPKERPMR